jgi:flagellar L-ring protein FlgH
MTRQLRSTNRLLATLAGLLPLAAVTIMLPMSLHAQRVGSDGSLFTDIKAARVGDLLTVLVYEDAQASNSSQLKTEEKSDANTKSTGGVGPLHFIPLFSADNTNNNKYDGKGENSRTGLLKGKMTVEVIAERNNGDLVIQGSRVVTINSDHQTMTLTGIVRRADINPDNTLESYNIAEAQIVYTGKGPGADGSKPGLITRALNWIF